MNVWPDILVGMLAGLVTSFLGTLLILHFEKSHEREAIKMLKEDNDKYKVANHQLRQQLALIMLRNGTARLRSGEDLKPLTYQWEISDDNDVIKQYPIVDEPEP